MHLIQQNIINLDSRRPADHYRGLRTGTFSLQSPSSIGRHAGCRGSIFQKPNDYQTSPVEALVVSEVGAFGQFVVWQPVR